MLRITTTLCGTCGCWTHFADGLCERCGANTVKLPVSEPVDWTVAGLDGPKVAENGQNGPILVNLAAKVANFDYFRQTLDIDPAPVKY